MFKRSYFLSFNCLAPDFDLYEKAFRNSLQTFKVYMPELTDAQKQDMYSTRKGGKKDEASFNLPVIGSLAFVALFVIWFLVKRLASGEEEDEEEYEEGTEKDEEVRKIAAGQAGHDPEKRDPDDEDGDGEDSDDGGSDDGGSDD